MVSPSLQNQRAFTLVVSVFERNRCSPRTCYNWRLRERREKRVSRLMLLQAAYSEPLHPSLMGSLSCKRICTKLWAFVRLMLTFPVVFCVCICISLLFTIFNKPYCETHTRLGHRTQILKCGRACASSLTTFLDLLV